MGGGKEEVVRSGLQKATYITNQMEQFEKLHPLAQQTARAICEEIGTNHVNAIVASRE